MRVCQLLCVGLALTLSSCASWHHRDQLFRGQSTQRPSGPINAQPLELEQDEATETDAAEYEATAPTLTPPIEGVSHRTGYRGQPERARPVRKERPPVNPPGLGFIELPPPPDAD